MSLFRTLKAHVGAQFLDVIEWLDSSNDTLVYRFPIFNQAIQDGGRLVVREGQAAVFIAEGVLSEVFGPGTYELSTRNQAIWSFFQSIKYALNYPYKGDIYFVSTRQFTAQKWGTPKPILLHDPQIGPVRVRAFGVFAYRVTDPAQFLREVVGTDGLFTTDEINGQLRAKLVAAMADALQQQEGSVLRLRSMQMGEALCAQMAPFFAQHYGVTLTDVTIESVSLPDEVEKMLDKRSSMGLLGDMNQYTAFQAANAIEAAASNPGGGGMGPALMNAGMGLAMGNVMGSQLQAGVPGTFNPAMAPSAPPAPPPGAARLHYSGAAGQLQLTPQEIAQRVAGDRAGQHHVWAPGWPGWKGWQEVPEVATLVPPATPPSAAGATFHYHGAEGQLELVAADVAGRVRSRPAERHLVWRQGMAGWTEAKDVPEIAMLVAGGPPPLPPGGGAPPPPV